MIDIFNDDAFSLQQLTATINKLPYVPGRIGALGLFQSEGISTTSVVVEERDGVLKLIPTSPRGGPAHVLDVSPRRARSFLVPHLQKESTLRADEVQNVRAFGSENAVAGVQQVVNSRLAVLRQEHEVTLEYQRVGAIQGMVMDADGVTPIFNLFTEFNVVQNTIPFAFSSPTFEVRQGAVDAMRLSEDELGAEPVTDYIGFAGDAFFDALIAHAKVYASVQYQESSLMRADLRRGFVYGGITWINYRGRVGSIDFFPTDEAFVVPLGTGIFITRFAPADFLETVNTVGLPYYAKIASDPEFNRWTKVHTQSNPLVLCLRPRAVVNITMA